MKRFFILALCAILSVSPVLAGSMTLLGAGKPAAGAAFSLAWAGNLEDNIGGTTITFTAVAIGAADTNRIVGVGVWWRSVADSDTITSMTVGGVSASQASGARSTRADGGLSLSDIWYAAVPTGTTANVVVNFSASAARAGVSTYRIITTTPTPSATGFGVSVAGPPSTTTSSSVTVPSGGAGFAMYGSRNQTSTTTWTNATGDYGAIIGANLAGVSSAKFTATNAITGSGDGNTGAAISAATWGP